MPQLSELLYEIGISPTTICNDFDVRAVRWDARDCQPGDVFVAATDLEIEGPYRSIGLALERGVTAIVADETSTDLPINEAQLILVPDARVALAKLLYAFSCNPQRKLKVIAVTGTKGKTTTTYLIRAMIEATGRKAAVVGSNGVFTGDETLLPNITMPTGFTTPECHILCTIFCQLVAAGYEYVILETSSHGIFLERIAGISFHGAVFTNLYYDHLDFHGNRDEYARVKRTLFTRLRSDAPAIFNGDDEYSAFMASDCNSKLCLFVGRGSNANLQITNESVTTLRSKFSLTEAGSNRTSAHLLGSFQLPLLGRFNIMNTALAVALVRAIGLDFKQAIKKLGEFKGVPGRMQVLRALGEPLTIIDFAHCARSLREALEECRRILTEQSSQGRLSVVFGCGGEPADKAKRPTMGRVAVDLADTVIITDDNPRRESGDEIIFQIMEGIPTSLATKVKIIRNRKAAIVEALSTASKSDVVLVAGKGCERQQIIGDQVISLSDAEIVREVMGVKN